ncbi:sensor histidine kinase [Hoeflea sp. TYP-13]|uniref:sensor histidine kinase n=1 Tax=Hoeflea sp. TYP-13 TaxID=3230023 RepID=UPI0034C6D3B6
MLSIKNNLSTFWRRTALRQALALAVAIVAILALVWMATYFLVRTELRSVHPESAEEALEIINGAFRFAFVAIAAAAIAIGVFLGGRAQRRVNRISSTLSKVAQGDLAARTEAPPGGDDLDYVGTRIDATLNELQRVVLRMRDLSANVAHDLRTPVARLRANLEDAVVAVEKEHGNSGEIRAAIEKTDQLAAVIDAIMRIAHVESGARKAAFAPVDLIELAQAVADTFAPVVEDSGRHFKISTGNPGTVIGDRDLLVQLLANLIQNAIRHTPPDSTVRLSVDGLSVSVCDDGPGVPESERERILEPTYRMDKSRNTAGAGLGLALVAAVAELHEARLTLDDNPAGRGLCVRLMFDIPGSGHTLTG